jgi:hypothetical protein
VVIGPEHHVLGHAAGEQHHHVLDQLLLGPEVAVLLGQVERVAEGAPARDDRDLVHALDGGEELGAQGVARLVVGDHPLLLVGDHALRLHAGHHPLERCVEVLGEDHVAAAAPREDRRLVADVGEVRPGQAARLAGDQLEVDVGQRLVVRVDAEDVEAPGEVGGRDEDLAVEAARAQEGGVELCRADSRPAITMMLSALEKPSISTSSWLSVWSFSPEMSLPRVAPTASSSLMNTIAWACLRAARNRRRIRAAPRPANISTNDDAD